MVRRGVVVACSVVGPALALLLASTTPAAGRTVLLGDSIIAGGSVKGRLEGMTGVSMEMRAMIGARLHEGYTTSVPGQYYGIDHNPTPTTIIMDGSGNDVLEMEGDCAAFNDNCRRHLDEAAGIAAGLLSKMHDDGVQHVIYMSYYHAKGMDAAVDYVTDKLIGVCGSAPVDCHFVDVRYAGVPVSDDGVHPIDEGNQILAQRIVDVKNQFNIPL